MAAEMAPRDDVSMDETEADRCAMGEDCYYPEGASAFTEKQHPPDDWNRSKDHFPILKKDCGTLEPGNVRLMHVHCNRVDYSNLALEAHLLSLRDEDGQPMDQRVVDSAMETHLRLLAENSGRRPSGRSAYKSASRDAHEMNDALRRDANLPMRRHCSIDGAHARRMSCVRQQAQLASRASETNLTTSSSERVHPRASGEEGFTRRPPLGPGNHPECHLPRQPGQPPRASCRTSERPRTQRTSLSPKPR